MTKLVITVNLDKKSRPTQEEITASDYIDELDFWVDFAMADPAELFDNATWEIREDEEAAKECQ